MPDFASHLTASIIGETDSTLSGKTSAFEFIVFFPTARFLRALNPYFINQRADSPFIDLHVSQRGSNIFPAASLHHIFGARTIIHKPSRERMPGHMRGKNYPSPLAERPEPMIKATAIPPRKNAADMIARIGAEHIQHRRMQRHDKPLIGFADVVADARLGEIDVLPCEPQRVANPPALPRPARSTGSRPPAV
jgi:hypothetical protein